MIEQPRKQVHYFAEDGNFGRAENLAIIITENFTKSDWQFIDFLLQFADWTYTVEMLKILCKLRN
jgi:hypothetical protein